MRNSLGKDWQSFLMEELSSSYFTELVLAIDHAYATKKVYPPKSLLFSAFNACPLDSVKVVIIGQDPYHGPYQANGMAFSVQRGIKIPPSLRNIYKEIIRDFGDIHSVDGDLGHWAKQGVLLLNSTLSVEAGSAGSHQKLGWEQFTASVIKKLSKEKEGLVFMLWGAFAQKKAEGIDRAKHLVLKSVHPSPLSAHRGFIGCGHFSSCNDYLKKNKKEAIAW